MFAKRIQVVLIAGSMFLLMACGPETIFLKSGFDTPSHHVANGKQLLENGKYDAALSEFLRAQEQLDETYAPIYVGIGLARAHKGEFAAAYEALEAARRFTHDAAGFKEIDQAHETVRRLELQENPNSN